MANLCAGPGSGSCPSTDGTVAVLLGKGDGTFQAPLRSDGGQSSSSLALADVNGDGKLDAVVLNFVSGVVGVSVLFGNGDGTFQPAVFTGTAPSSSSLAVGDVNGDGKPDLIVGLECGDIGCDNGAISILLGNGDGTFQAGRTYGSGGIEGMQVIAADVNSDGKLDLIVTNECGGSGGGCGTNNIYDGAVGVLLGNGDGTFKGPAVYDTGGKGSILIAVADVNGDGSPDLLLPTCVNSQCTISAVSVMLGNGDGTFQVPMAEDVGARGSSIAVGDVNGDGKSDLLLTQCTNGSCSESGVVVALGNGDGSFQTPIGYLSRGYNPRSLVTTDVNEDGKPDVIVVNSCTSSLCTGDGLLDVLLNVVRKTATATIVSTSGSPSQVNQSVTFTATTTSTYGPVPDGITVTFSDNKVVIGTGITSHGVATFSTSLLAIGTHLIKASYPVNSFFMGSYGRLKQIVQP